MCFYLFFSVGFLSCHLWLRQIYPRKQREFYSCSLNLGSGFKSLWSYEESEGKMCTTAGSGLSLVAWYGASQGDSEHITVDARVSGSLQQNGFSFLTWYQTVTLQRCWLAPGAPGEVLFSWRELWCVTFWLQPIPKLNNRHVYFNGFLWNASLGFMNFPKNSDYIWIFL